MKQFKPGMELGDAQSSALVLLFMPVCLALLLSELFVYVRIQVYEQMSEASLVKEGVLA